MEEGFRIKRREREKVGRYVSSFLILKQSSDPKMPGKKINDGKIILSTAERNS